MGLRRALTRLATARVHALVVEPPGCFAIRVATERAAARRGWIVTDHPGDADLLVVLGTPSAELRSAADRLYEAMPGPRARVEVRAEASVEGALAQAVRLLEDEAAQQADARTRGAGPGRSGHQMGHGQMDHGSMGHGQTNHEQMGHGSMGHGHAMAAPGGIPLAARGGDRDGLKMDRLHLPLGPVLRFWPAGLVLTCVLQGDIVTEAEAEWMGGSSTDDDTMDRWLRAASWLDSAAAVLALGGSAARVAAVRAARDGCLDHDASAAALVTRQRQILTRSRVLRWSLRHLAQLDPLLGESNPAFAGDAFLRLLSAFDAASAELSGRGTLAPDPSVLLARLPELVAGRELGEVRLLVAGLAPAFGTAAGRRLGGRGASEGPR